MLATNLAFKAAHVIEADRKMDFSKYNCLSEYVTCLLSMQVLDIKYIFIHFDGKPYVSS